MNLLVSIVLPLCAFLLLCWTSIGLPEFSLAFFINGVFLVTFLFGSVSRDFYFRGAILELVVLIGLGSYLWRNRPRFHGLNGFLPSVVVGFAVVFLLGLLYTPAFPHGLAKTIQYMGLNVVSFFFPLILAEDRKRLERFIAFLALIGLIIVSLSLLFWSVWLPSEENVGQFAPLGNPNWYARYLGMGVFALLISRNRVTRFKLICIVASLGSLFFLVMTGSRAGLFSFVLALAVYFIWLDKSKWIERTGLALLIGITLYISLEYFTHSNTYSSRNTLRYLRLLVGLMKMDLSHVYEDSTSALRLKMWQSALHIFKEHPLLGVGTAGYTRAHTVTYKFAEIHYPHNIVLEMAADHGVIGLVLLLGFLGSIGRAFIVAASNHKQTAREDPIFSFAAMTLIFAFLNAQLSGDVPSNSSLWLAGGLIYGLALEPSMGKVEMEGPSLA